MPATQIWTHADSHFCNRAGRKDKKNNFALSTFLLRLTDDTEKDNRTNQLSNDDHEDRQDASVVENAEPFHRA